jgi:hypothetical protein
MIVSASRLVAGAQKRLTGAMTLVAGALTLVAGDPRAFAGATRLGAGAPRCSKVHRKFSPAFQGVPKPRTIAPMVLLYRPSGIPVTLKAVRNALLWSHTLLKLTHLSLHSTFSQTLLEASSDCNTFCWCRSDFRYGKLHNDKVSYSLWYIMKVLAAFLGTIESDTLPTPFWKSAFTEHQPLLLMHLGYTMWCMNPNIYKPGVGTLNRHISKRCSCNSLPDNHNLIHDPICNLMFLRCLFNLIGSNFIYRK